MGLFDRLSVVVRANLNDMIEKAENPEEVLEQAITDMQEKLVHLRQAVARAIAAQKGTEQQYNKNQTEAKNWQQRAQLALNKGDENLAREALTRRKSCLDAISALKSQLDQQTAQVETLKRNLIALESKISEAKVKRDTLKARLNESRASEQLQSRIGHLGTSSAMAAFERMEEKVREIEARSQALINPGDSDNSDVETRLRNVERKLEAMKTHLLEQQKTTSLLISQNSEALGEVRSLLAEVRSQASFELTSRNLDEQIRLLESGSDVDDEIAAMKAQLLGNLASQQAQSNSDEEAPSLSDSEADNELEALRK
jgi:phage shock protein A